jgi:transposase-like protein
MDQTSNRREVLIKCRRSQDPSGLGSCNSSMVHVISDPGSSVAAYKCPKCNYSWTVAVGGTINV